MYIKILGSIIILCSCSGYGFLKGQEYKKHIEALEELISIANAFASETSYRRLPIADLAAIIADRTNIPYSSWLKNLSCELNHYGSHSFAQIWEQEAGKLLPHIPLSFEENKELLTFGTQLAHYNIELQAQAFRLLAAKYEEQKRNLLKVVHEKQKLCNSLGVLTGIFLIILLI